MSDKLFKKTDGRRRRTRFGGYSIIIALVVAAILIVINLIVAALPATLTKLDLSEKQLYTISEETEKIVSAVDCDITVYVLDGTDQDDYADGTLDLLGRYTAANSRIKVKHVDPVANPTFYTAYTDTAPSQYSLIVVSEKRSRVVDFSEIVVSNQSFDYSTFSYNTTYSYAGESAITSAIEYVSGDDLPIIYKLDGNGEPELQATTTDAISTDNMELRSLNLLSSENGVPEDASLVMIYAPKNDLSEEEIGYLEAYMSRGGNILMMTYFNDKNPNLTAFAEKYGLIGESGLLCEGDAQRYYQNAPYNLLPPIVNSSVSSLMGNTNVNILLPQSHGILKSENLPDNISIETLLATTESAYVKKELPDSDSADSSAFDRADSDVSGSFMLGAIASDSESGAHLIWFSSPYISFDPVQGTGNLDFFMATLGSVCDKKASVSIAAKEISVEPLVVPAASVNFWMIFTCIIIPLAVLACGLVIWIRRRKS